MIRWIACLLFLAPLFVGAGQTEVQGARLWVAPDQTRLVVDAAAAVEHRIFPLKDPHRLVIDIPDARFSGQLPVAERKDLLVIGLRSGVHDGDNLRIVIDLKRPVRAKSFLAAPNERYGHRIVVDLLPREGDGEPTGSALPVRDEAAARDLIVAIDAGHGGEDPGAIGTAKTEEKTVTLAVARKLAALINQETGLRAVLIRDGDYFLGLEKRVQLARRKRADLFLSIHADAFDDKGVRGSSIFTLSQKGASSKAAEWLANRENSADRIGGIALEELEDKDPNLLKILWDMQQNGNMEHSQLAAKAVLGRLGRVGVVHNRHVQQAPFAVLKAPDIPSILVEIAFITNAEEERRLRERRYQDQLARALFAGVRDYFQHHPPPGTRFARRDLPRQHIIHSGDTLLEIANQYEVSLSSLRRANRLEGDLIRVGQVLTIPES